MFKYEIPIETVRWQILLGMTEYVLFVEMISEMSFIICLFANMN